MKTKNSVGSCLLLLACVLLALLTSCTFDHTNPFDPDSKATVPGTVLFAYAENISSIGPTSIGLKWNRSTEADFYFYVVARSNETMNLTNLVLTTAQQSQIAKELLLFPMPVLATMNAVTIKSNAPIFYSLFHPIKIIAEANSSSYLDTDLTKTTRYNYAILIFKKNLTTYSVSSEFAVETTPDIASARTSDLLWNYRDAPGEAYDIDIDEVNKKVFVSGYAYGVAYYWNDYNITQTIYSTNGFDAYLAVESIETAFDDSQRGYIWEANIIAGGQAPTIDSTFQLIKGFAVNNSGGMYIPELSYATGWGLYKMTNTDFYDPYVTGTQIAYTNSGIDDFTSHLCLDLRNQTLYMVGSSVKIFDATSRATAVRTADMGVKVRLNGVAYDSKGNLFLSDAYSNVVYKLTKTGGTGSSPQFGKPSLFVGSIGAKLGQFQNIFDVAVDGSDNVFIADTGNQRIQKFNSAGQFLTAINVKELGGDSLANPRGLKYYNNKLYVACSKALLEIPL